LDKRVTLITPEKAHPGVGGNLVFHYLFIIQFLRHQFQNSKAENIISFGDAFNPLVLLASYGLKKKIHISDRTSPDYKFKWHVKVLKLITYKKADTFIAQTSVAKSWNIKKFNNKLNIVVIPNQVREVSLDLAAPKEKVILYVGRFAWEKNPATLIKAFSKVNDKQGWKLIMLGDGPLLKEMITLSLTLGLENEIEFKGQVKDVDYYFSRASIYVLPSVLEGFPNALCEAMAFGLPCICTTTIPYSDLGKEEIDFLVANLEDTDDLSNTIQRLINDEALRTFLGANAKQINKRLSLEIIGQKFETILK
jgi:glycosyltransferase involved in cell wall biosynthesis